MTLKDKNWLLKCQSQFLQLILIFRISGTAMAVTHSVNKPLEQRFTELGFWPEGCQDNPRIATQMWVGKVKMIYREVPELTSNIISIKRSFKMILQLKQVALQ